VGIVFQRWRQTGIHLSAFGGASWLVLRRATALSTAHLLDILTICT
jgi:hypothetical protein